MFAAAGPDTRNGRLEIAAISHRPSKQYQRIAARWRMKNPFKPPGRASDMESTRCHAVRDKYPPRDLPRGGDVTMTGRAERTGLVAGFLLVGPTSGIAVSGAASFCVDAKGRAW